MAHTNYEVVKIWIWIFTARKFFLTFKIHIFYNNFVLFKTPVYFLKYEIINFDLVFHIRKTKVDHKSSLFKNINHIHNLLRQ